MSTNPLSGSIFQCSPAYTTTVPTARETPEIRTAAPCMQSRHNHHSHFTLFRTWGAVYRICWRITNVASRMNDTDSTDNNPSFIFHLSYHRPIASLCFLPSNRLCSFPLRHRLLPFNGKTKNDWHRLSCGTSNAVACLACLALPPQGTRFWIQSRAIPPILVGGNRHPSHGESTKSVKAYILVGWW